MNTQMDRINPARWAWGTLAGAVVLALVGCGGGGGGASGGGTVAVSTSVIDGPLRNALVCLDRNNNGECDAGEEQTRTNADGVATLNLPPEVARLYPLVAVVGTDAVDRDHGPVLTPYTMTTPAGSTGVISPLTTMVHEAAQSNGVSTEQAEQIVKDATGLSGSMMVNFIASGDATATAVARVIVVATQEQTTSLAGRVGTPAADGAPITAAQLKQAIKKRMLTSLPRLVEFASSAAYVAAADDAAKRSLVNTDLIPTSLLTTGNLALEVAINNQVAPDPSPSASAPSSGASAPSSGASAPSAGYNVRRVLYTDANNNAVTVGVSSLAQATPDASGSTRGVDRRYHMVSGARAAWNVGSEPRFQSELNFDGSTWVACALNHEGPNSAADSKGYSTSNFCNSRETSKASIAAIGIAGRTMTSVLADLAAASPDDWQISSAGQSLLGSATFGAGATLRYRVGSILTSAPTYYPGSDNVVLSSPASAGGDGRVSGNVCSTAQTDTVVTSLADMIAHATGTPCIYNPQTLSGTSFTSDNPRTQWGSTTVSLGTIGTVDPNGTPTAFYTGNQRIRVSFPGGNATTYHQCKERFGNGGSTHNCVTIGSGTYSIATMGDAQVMSFTNLPGVLASRSSNRVFVARGGKVYFGYQTKLSTFSRPRLNTVASGALLAQLGLPAVNPEVPLALTATSYRGSWVAKDTTAPVAALGTLLNLANDGTWACTDLSNNTVFSCTIAITNPATGAFSFTNNVNGTYGTGTLGFLTGLGTGQPYLPDGTADTPTNLVRR